MPKRADLAQALYLAVINHKYEEAQRLLQADADPNWQNPETGETALHYAAENGLVEYGILLLIHEVNTTLKNKKNSTALEIACNSKQWDFIQKVVEYKSPRFTSNYLGSVLITSARNNELQTVLCLIAAKATLTWYITDTKNTSLHFAAIHNNPIMVAALVAAGASS